MDFYVGQSDERAQGRPRSPADDLQAGSGQALLDQGPQPGQKSNAGRTGGVPVERTDQPDHRPPGLARRRTEGIQRQVKPQSNGMHISHGRDSPNVGAQPGAERAYRWILT